MLTENAQFNRRKNKPTVENSTANSIRSENLSRERPQERCSAKPVADSSRKPYTRASAKSSRKPLPADVIHAVNLRDQGRCQAQLPNGALCGETRWMHFHHVKPISQGGTDTVENLMTLCSGHHRIWHRHVE